MMDDTQQIRLTSDETDAKLRDVVLFAVETYEHEKSEVDSLRKQISKIKGQAIFGLLIIYSLMFSLALLEISPDYALRSIGETFDPLLASALLTIGLFLFLSAFSIYYRKASSLRSRLKEAKDDMNATIEYLDRKIVPMLDDTTPAFRDLVQFRLRKLEFASKR